MKKRFLLAVLMVVVLGVAFQSCGTAESEREMKVLTAQIEEMKALTAQIEANKTIARRDLLEVWNQGKLEVIDETAAEDLVFHDPSGDILGVEGYRQYVTMYRTAFPDVQFTIEDQVAEGDKVVTRWSSTATHNGELMGIPPTGLPGPTTGISIGRFVGGKVVETWSSWDALGMWQKLGVIPPIGEGQK